MTRARHPGGPGRRAMLAVPVLLAVTACALGCASGGGPGAAKGRSAFGVPVAPEFDSITVVLWHFDETTGRRVANAGGVDLTGIAGVDTRPGLGRIGGARQFSRSSDSFVWAESTPALARGGSLTVSAWIRVDAFGQYEDTPIAGCWNPRSNEQSWFLAVGGRNTPPELSALPGPGYHRDLLPLTSGRIEGRLMFGYQPERAGQPTAFLSNEVIDLDRWTHVAASIDGQVVRLFVNGRLDAQFAVPDGIRGSGAPLLVGNLFDSRFLTSFSGELRLGDDIDRNPYYAFEGSIDELRISSEAREEFPNAR